MVQQDFIDIESSQGGSVRVLVSVPPAGNGPGLLLLPETLGLDDDTSALAAQFAAEGYLCFAPELARSTASRGNAGAGGAVADTIPATEQALADIATVVARMCDHAALRGRMGAVGYGHGGLLASLAAARGGLDCAIAYYPAGLAPHAGELSQVHCPLLLHVGSADAKFSAQALDAIRSHAPALRLQLYAGCGHGFANAARASHDKPAAMMAYSRTIALLREVMGPVYDLSALWEKHTEYEFAVRDVDATMATMVAEPYVNHVPTMTGGVGHADLKRFYRHHFVNSNPPDTRLIPISRTVGADRLVDEMVFCFTHTCEIPWMLPGIAPTGRYVEVPLVAIVNFRGDKLYHEHIYWDQASVLVQVGKLDPAGLPVAGIATAHKLIDPALPSNELMAQAWAASADQAG